jgi:pyrroline-5-carboxylate reductase
MATISDKKLSILGCGNIGLSILQGIMKTGTVPAKNITVTRRNIHEISYLSDEGIQLTSSNKDAVSNSDLVIIAVKPYNLKQVLEEIRDQLDSRRHILVSITTGVTLANIESVIGKEMPVFRVMPNISASIGKSVSCICFNNASTGDVEDVRHLFDYVGTTMTIEEDLMESATILGACGIAFVLRFIRAMVQGGIQIGFDAKTASAIVNHTVKGAAELLIERNEHPEFEIDKVTTPKGCTIVGLNEMEHNGFSSSLIKGIVASFEKIGK